MTKYGNKRYKKRESETHTQNGIGIIWGFVCFFSLALIIRNSDIAIKYMSEGLSLCARTVIPSLFPFMVISDLIVSSGTAALAGKLLQLPVKYLFGIGSNGGGAILLGFICGFPIGTSAAVSLYDRGKLSRGELSRILTFSNIPSSAFIISAVGISLFGSVSFGRALYVMILISAIITGIAQNVIFKIKSKKEIPPEEYFYGVSKADLPEKDSSIPQRLTNAVSSSAICMLKVCAFVVFFGAFVGTLGMLLDRINMPEPIKAVLFSVFEMTGGMSLASATNPPMIGALIAAFTAGWSGISVHCQIISICSGRGISFKPYVFSKLCQGILCALQMILYLKYISSDIPLRSESVFEPSIMPLTEYAAPIITLIFMTSIAIIFIKIVYTKFCRFATVFTFQSLFF